MIEEVWRRCVVAQAVIKRTFRIKMCQDVYENQKKRRLYEKRYKTGSKENKE